MSEWAADSDHRPEADWREQSAAVVGRRKHAGRLFRATDLLILAGFLLWLACVVWTAVVKPTDGKLHVAPRAAVASPDFSPRAAGYPANAALVEQQVSAAVAMVEIRDGNTIYTGTAFPVGPCLWATAQHVVGHEAAPRLRSPTADLPAQVVATDREVDLAVLRVPDGSAMPMPLVLRSTPPSLLAEQQPFLLLGFPGSGNGALDVQVARHRFDGMSNATWGKGAYSMSSVISTVGPSLPGSSGSPLVDPARGDVVGVLVAGGEESLNGVSIPVSRLQALIGRVQGPFGNCPFQGAAAVSAQPSPVIASPSSGPPVAAGARPERIVVLLDASGSMADAAPATENARRSKYAFVLDELRTWLASLPVGTAVGVRVFGGLLGDGSASAATVSSAGSPAASRADDSDLTCHESMLARPISVLGPGEVNAVATRLSAVTPSGMTPLARTLEEAAADLGLAGGRIVLLSDGMDTCGGDPCAVARRIVDSNARVVGDLATVIMSPSDKTRVMCVPQTMSGRVVDLSSRPGELGKLRLRGPDVARYVKPALRVAVVLLVIVLGWGMIFCACDTLAAALARVMAWGNAGLTADFVFLGGAAGWTAIWLVAMASVPVPLAAGLAAGGAVLVYLTVRRNLRRVAECRGQAVTGAEPVPRTLELLPAAALAPEARALGDHMPGGCSGPHGLALRLR